MQRAVVTGATGFVGRRLVSALEAGGGAPERARAGLAGGTQRDAADDGSSREAGERSRRTHHTDGAHVVALGRDPARTRASLGPRVDARRWDPNADAAPAEALARADAVFHLAGESVASGRWTAARRARIRDSRVEGTRRLVAALARLEPAARPRVLVSASAVGFYGDRGDEVLTEASSPGEGFLADVCREWEQEADAARAHGLRVVRLRLGVVLGPGGGALERMLPLFRAGAGGRVTLTGAQWVAWVHLDDVVGLALHAAARDDLAGPLNVVAPHPVRNRDLTRALAAALGRPAVLPVPSLALRLAFGDMATVLTASQRVVPALAGATGYRFLHPTIDDALAAALAPAREDAPWALIGSNARS